MAGIAQVEVAPVYDTSILVAFYSHETPVLVKVNVRVVLEVLGRWFVVTAFRVFAYIGSHVQSLLFVFVFVFVVLAPVVRTRCRDGKYARQANLVVFGDEEPCVLGESHLEATFRHVPVRVERD